MRDVSSGPSLTKSQAAFRINSQWKWIKIIKEITFYHAYDIYIYVYTTIYTYIVLCGYVFMSINVYHYIPKKDAHETETFQIPK